MGPDPVKKPRIGVRDALDGCTRREFLRTGAAVAVGMAVGGIAPAEAPPSGELVPVLPTRSRPPPIPMPWWVQEGGARSRVVEVRSRDVLRGTVTDPVALGDMFEHALVSFTHSTDARSAWGKILKGAKRVLVKFNEVGAELLGSSDAMARVLFDSLMSSGRKAEDLLFAEIDPRLVREFGAARPPAGWGEAITVGGQPEELSNALLWAEAVVNVGFLKTHPFAGISCCLKNLSHWMIRHPARFHANACAPYVGEIVGNPIVSQRLRLNVVNALRVIGQRGPDADEADVIGYGGLLVGQDPVATDVVGLELLALEQRRVGFPVTSAVPYLAAAAEQGLGRWRPAEIERATLAS